MLDLQEYTQGSLSSIVSPLNDNDILEFMEGFAGFTFFRSSGKQEVEAEDELVALDSPAGMTMFARKKTSSSLHRDVSALSCAEMDA